MASRKDEIAAQYPEFNITLLDIFSKMDISGRNKYLALICRIFRTDLASSKARILNEENKEIANSFATPMEQKFAAVLLDTYIKNHSDTLNTFMQFNEENAVEQKDVNKYNNIEEIKIAIDIVKLKKEEKRLEKEIVKIYENEEWLILRPLSWEASSKYGAGTKWCTTFTNDKSYFERYSKSGPLIYIISRKNNYKVAFHKDIVTTEHTKRVTTIWNDQDKQMDWFDLDLPQEITQIVIDEIKKGVANWELIRKDKFLVSKIDPKAFQTSREEEQIRLATEELRRWSETRTGTVERSHTNDPFYDYIRSEEQERERLRREARSKPMLPQTLEEKQQEKRHGLKPGYFSLDLETSGLDYSTFGEAVRDDNDDIPF